MTVLNRYKLLIVLILAAAVRVTALWLFPGVFAFDQTGVIHGSSSYDAYAVNLIQTGVYGLTPGVPDAIIPPLYSYALVLIYSLFGRGYLQVGLFHTVLDLVSMIMLYVIAVRLMRAAVRNETRAEWVGTLSAAFYAFYPYLIFQNLTLIDTPFFMTLMFAFVLAMVMLREQERFDRYTLLLALLAGLTLGLATLLRPILPPLAVLMAVWFLFRRSLWQTLLRLGIVAIVSVVVLLPWIARSSAVYQTFVLLSVNGGSNLLQGNSPYTIPYLQAGYDVQWTLPDAADPYAADTPERDQKRAAMAIQFWRDNPELLPELFWTKFLVHWSIDIAPRFNPTSGELPRLEGQPDVQASVNDAGDLTLEGLPPGDPVDAYSEPLFDHIGRVIHRVYFGGMLALAVIGVILSLRAWRDVSLLWFVQIAMTVMYVLFHPSTRYRAPSDPFLFVFSAFAVVSVVGWFVTRANKRRRLPPIHRRYPITR